MARDASRPQLQFAARKVDRDCTHVRELTDAEDQCRAIVEPQCAQYRHLGETQGRLRKRDVADAEVVEVRLLDDARLPEGALREELCGRS